MEKMNEPSLLAFIDSVSFMLDDITLFLDTHPKCQEALESYNHYKHLRKQAVKEYTSLYGPLNDYEVNAENYWTWVNNPWPWERGCGC